MLRADWETTHPAAGAIEQKLIDTILPLISRADIVLLSDYAKGVLCDGVLDAILARMAQAGRLVIGRASCRERVCLLV